MLQKTIDWENNYFKLHGEPHNLQIEQKRLGSVMAGYKVQNNVRCFLLINIRRKDNQYHWGFPRGFQVKDETFAKTAQREFKEETNLQTDHLKELGVVMPDSGLLDTKIHLFTGQILPKQTIKLQNSERITDYRFV